MEQYQKEKFGGILICMIIRIIAGAFFSIMTGLSMVLQPMSGGVGMLTLIAGFMCAPAAILFFMRKPAFTWSFLIMIALNAIGGIVIASHPLMRLAAMFMPAQSLFLVLVIIMDALFVIFLLRSRRVAAIFGGNLFKAPGGVAWQPRQPRHPSRCSKTCVCGGATEPPPGDPCPATANRRKRPLSAAASAALLWFLFY